jgi:Xaa-Pro aminopeptidase
MVLHFSREEFTERQERGKAAIAARGLDGVLLFAPESHFYL